MGKWWMKGTLVYYRFNLNHRHVRNLQTSIMISIVENTPSDHSGHTACLIANNVRKFRWVSVFELRYLNDGVINSQLISTKLVISLWCGNCQLHAVVICTAFQCTTIFFELLLRSAFNISYHAYEWEIRNRMFCSTWLVVCNDGWAVITVRVAGAICRYH